MAFLLAFLPIAVILVLMAGLRWGAARSGGAGYLAALLVSWLYFGATPELLAYAHAKALLLALDVLLIIWAAFLLYRVADEAGAIRRIGQALPYLTADRGMQALLIGWVFASFLQGVGGFGVPVAVVAPLLSGLGYAPLAAVLLPSVGHGWAVTFGSLGSSFNALMAASGLPGALLAPGAALYLGLAGVVSGFMVAHIAGGWAAARRLAVAVLGLGVVMGVVQYLVAVSGLWNIAAFAGSVGGLLAGYPLARRFRGEQSNGAELDLKALLVAVSGYLGLVVIILGVQFIPGLRDFLGQVVIRVSFPELVTRQGFLTPAGPGRVLVLFRHTGVVLGYGALLAYGIYARAGWYTPGAIGRILGGTYSRVLSSSVSILSMVSMAVIMEHAGMTDQLARGLAEGVGQFFPAVAAWIGALGAFMTGSNTNSNVVFSAMQLRTAELLGYPAAAILAGQTAGAALASVLAPTKIVVGASTAGMAGKEGEVLRRLAVYVLPLVALISVLTVLAVLTGGWGGS